MQQVQQSSAMRAGQHENGIGIGFGIGIAMVIMVPQWKSWGRSCPSPREHQLAHGHPPA